MARGSKFHQRRSRQNRSIKPAIEGLESRILMHFDPDDPDHFDPVPLSPVKTATKLSPHVGPFKSATATASIPALNSDADATAQLFLDFNGAPATSWGNMTSAITPAYDTDGDPSTFTAGELTNISQIWSRVSEIYSPFNINVTTVDPGNLTDHITTRVVIGGDGAWYGAAGGVAYVGAFYNSAPNIAWVFPKMLSNGNVKFTADAISHEAGHTFGLQHQSTYSGTSKTAEYNPGSSAKAPIMGNSYSAARSLWWKGPSSLGSSVIQDDVAVLSGASDAFGYRTDDHGNTIAAADAMDVSDTSATATGIITQITDKDYFSFSTLQGTVSFSVSPAAIGGNLDATLTLYNSSGTVLATANTTALGESITANVAAGQYFLAVGSHGSVGDIGQYSVSGTIVTSPNFVAAPATLTAAASNGSVALHWTDMSWNETGFKIESSSDNGSNWDVVTTTDSGVTSYTDSSASVGTTYQYRVMAVGASENSTYSNTATIAVTPATPANLTASSFSATRIDLDWDDVTGETGYRVDRSANNATWVTLTSLGAGVSAFSNTELTAGTKYYYRVVALSAAGNSLPTASVNSTTRPVAPTTLTGTPTATTIALAWTNVAGETGYKIERSTDGSTWAQIATTAANVVAYTNTALASNTSYSYRVKAINAGGESTATSALTKKTLLPAPTGMIAAVTGTTTINLNWDESTGETGYRLERLNGTAWVQIGADLDPNDSEVDVTGLTPGTAYSFRVHALNDGGVSLPGVAATATTIPPAPTGVVSTALSTTQIKTTWLNVAGETGYKIERSADGSSWSQIGTTAANVLAYTDATAVADTVYHYRVKAYNLAGTGEASSGTTTRSLLAAPAGLTAEAVSTTEIDLEWDDSSTETGYKLEKLAGTAWVQVGTNLAADTTSYNVTGLVAGTAYSFRLHAINDGGASAAGTTAVATTVPPAPVATATVVSNSQIKLAWTNVGGETGYKLERTVNGTDWTQVGTTAANIVTLTDGSLGSNVSYTYRVRAYNAAGNGAYSANVSKKTLLAAPTGVTADASSASVINLTWDDSEGETGYRVEKLSGTAWVVVGTTLAADHTSLSVTGLAGGTSYAFRVRALNDGGWSAQSTSGTALTKPAAPATLTTTSPATGQIKLAWANVAGETGYLIERSTDGATWGNVGTVGVNVLTFLDSNLMSGTYYYRVRATNASGDSAASATATRTI